MIRDPAAQALGQASSAVGLAQSIGWSGSRRCGASRLVRDDSFILAEPPLSSRTSAAGAMIRDPAAQALGQASSAVGLAQSIGWSGSRRCGASRLVRDDSLVVAADPPLSSRTSAAGAMIRDPAAQALGQASSAVGLAQSIGWSGSRRCGASRLVRDDSLVFAGPPSVIPDERRRRDDPEPSGSGARVLRHRLGPSRFRREPAERKIFRNAGNIGSSWHTRSPSRPRDPHHSIAGRSRKSQGSGS